MRAAIIGAGPAGLFLAKLLRKQSFEVDVFEQNPAGATYGFGIGLLGSSLKFLKKTDEDLYRDILDVSAHGDTMMIAHRGEEVVVTIEASVGVERIRLLRLLHSHCERLGVNIRYEQRIESVEALKTDYDVLVGADGVNSVVRKTYQDHFGSRITPQNNKFAWYATEKLFDHMSLIFEQTEYGLMIAHAYTYREDRGGFVVECDPETWMRAGFADMSDQETRAFCADIFAKYLDGRPLLSGELTWFTPNIVRTPRWSFENVVLIGDALRTVHPSIGSGTRVGMRDADVLARAFLEHGADIGAALETFQANRQAGSDFFQRAAVQSIAWYETVDHKLHLDPVTFAFSYMSRTGAVDYESLRRSDPDFVRAFEDAPSPVAMEGAAS
ncbi:MAG: FAD-dependent monooxygenase [Pseudomonadota bacterium]